MNRDFLLRIKDVSLCLLVAKNYELLLGRLEIQKVIYLVDSISAYLFVLSGTKGHQTYFYGPYDKNIQNALDALVIRDLAEICDIKVANNTVSCNYLITDSGMRWTNNLIKASASIQYRVQIVDGVIYSLVERNRIHKVKDLVYAEPLYAATKNYGHHYDLDFEHENSGHDYLALIEHYLKNNKDQTNIRFIADLYIDYLSSRDQILLGNSFTGGD
ncbi:hypothetical protein Psfp_03990 [Pelotomaculum sp. FP]|uniref:hypothetical protein n=1 Tax=Pelotomaculum sp. FP TaxID=261474 RepID=UPI0010652CD9|nr:hypothetical protein [Pelotomaculum sp. FP]TEB11292.1 hypothetical protein Psfp_03990 [Pelotomaculum sp. FP]